MTRSSELPHPSEAALARFEHALARALAGSRHDAGGDLVTALREVDATGTPAAVEEALRQLAGHPAAVVLFDAAVRLQDRHALPSAASATDAARPGSSPIGVVLSCSDADGRVRERAVRRLVELLDARQPLVELMPFLVVRTGDWVRPVRDLARAALALLLNDAPQRLLPTALPLTVLTDRRQRGGFARRQVFAALSQVPDLPVIEQLLSSPDPHVRRSVLHAVLGEHRLRLSVLVSLAERDRDGQVRRAAAEAAVREAVWTEQLDQLRRLAASPHREVRVLAVTGLIRAGKPTEATAFLHDPSALVRAVARDAARRTDQNAAADYQRAVRSETPTPGAIAGLAETGRAADADLLVPLLPDFISRRAHMVGGFAG